jgi:hypothetical protein
MVVVGADSIVNAERIVRFGVQRVRAAVGQALYDYRSLQRKQLELIGMSER